MSHEALLAHLRGSLAGSTAAGDRFAVAAERICRGTLLAFAGGLVARRGLLEDLVQESLMRVWANRRSCRADTGTAVAGWIASISRCAAVDGLRADGPPRVSLDEVPCSVMQVLPGTDAPREAARSIVELAWSLGIDANEVLWLRLVARASWQAIGAELGVSWTAARRRYQRAVAHLRILALTRPRHDCVAALVTRARRESAPAPRESPGESPPE